MSFIDRLLGISTHKTVAVRLPVTVYNALDTVIYLNKYDVDHETLILQAVDEYLKKNLWAAKAKSTYVTELTQVETFRTPAKRQFRGE